MMSRILPIKFRLWLKIGIENIKYAKIIKKIEEGFYKDYAVIIGTPVHDNMGDHLITYSEILFLNSMGYEKILEIPIEVYKYYRMRLVHAVSDQSDIFVNGGGWMGNVWPDDEKLMQNIVSDFSHHRIFIFPQTIYYDRRFERYEELVKSGEYAYNHCDNLVLCLRERNSYDFAKKHYRNAKVLLQPDITLFLHGKIKIHTKKNKKKKVGICMRNDREVTNQEIGLEITGRLSGYKHKYISTLEKYRIPTFLRVKAIRRKCRQFAECDFVVTDRLHGMLFAYILDIPCIAYDNLTKKVSGVYDEWLKEKSNILFIRETGDIQDIKDYLINLESRKNIDEIDFDILRREIRNGKN